MERKFRRFVRVAGFGIVGGSAFTWVNFVVVGRIWGIEVAGWTGWTVLAAWVMTLAILLARLDARDAARPART